jgi:hypothetical protein
MGKERTMFISTARRDQNDWLCYIVDNNGNKYGPAEFDSSTLGVDKIEGPSMYYKFKPNYGMGITLKYVNVPHNLIELRQFYMSTDITTINEYTHKELEIDMRNILIY